MKVLVTGANGFIGRALSRHLAATGHEVVGGVRSRGPGLAWMETRAYGDLEALDDVSAVVAGVDAIVHLAARVHMMRKTDSDPDAAYRRANATVTGKLAAAAADAGVGRFVFLSSVKVNGERTKGAAYKEEDAPAPEDAYGRSKLEAETALGEISERSGLSCVSLRVPLVYGPGVGANFAALLRLCDLPVPRPLAGLSANRRSLLFAGNLTHAIQTVLERPDPASATYLLSDGDDLSTADLVRRLRLSLNRSSPDLPIPAGVLGTIAALVGKKTAANRLCGSLQIDSSRFRRTFDWTPPFTVDQGIAATAAWYCARR